jgi:hypothetical protein
MQADNGKNTTLIRKQEVIDLCCALRIRERQFSRLYPRRCFHALLFSAVLCCVIFLPQSTFGSLPGVQSSPTLYRRRQYCSAVVFIQARLPKIPSTLLCSLGFHYGRHGVSFHDAALHVHCAHAICFKHHVWSARNCGVRLGSFCHSLRRQKLALCLNAGYACFYEQKT